VELFITGEPTIPVSTSSRAKCAPTAVVGTAPSATSAALGFAQAAKRATIIKTIVFKITADFLTVDFQSKLHI
jgi:hypothetical protein